MVTFKWATLTSHKIFCKEQCHIFSYCALGKKRMRRWWVLFPPLLWALSLTHSDWMASGVVVYSICHQINWNPVIVISSLHCLLAVVWNVFIYYSITKVRDSLQHRGESFSLPPLFLLGVSSIRGNLFLSNAARGFLYRCPECFFQDLMS